LGARLSRDDAVIGGMLRGSDPGVGAIVPKGFAMADEILDEPGVRGARTQSLFRDVTERMREINHAFSEVLPLRDWICECANPACNDRLELAATAYESVARTRRGSSSPPTTDTYEALRARTSSGRSTT
jgi:hypothetical protein